MSHCTALRVSPTAYQGKYITDRQPDTDLPLGAPLFWNQLSISWMGYQLLVECSLYSAIIHISREQIGSCPFQGHQCKVNTSSLWPTLEVVCRFSFLYQSPSYYSTPTSGFFTSHHQAVPHLPDNSVFYATPAPQFSFLCQSPSCSSAHPHFSEHTR